MIFKICLPEGLIRPPQPGLLLGNLERTKAYLQIIRQAGQSTGKTKNGEWYMQKRPELSDYGFKTLSLYV